MSSPSINRDGKRPSASSPVRPSPKRHRTAEIQEGSAAQSEAAYEPDSSARAEPLDTMAPDATGSAGLTPSDHDIRPIHFIKRGEDVYVPLIAIDELPEWIYINIPQTYTQAQVMECHGVVLFGPEPLGKYKVRVAANTPRLVNNRDRNASLHDQLENNLEANRAARAVNTEQRYHPTTPGVFGEKKYCTHWIRTGECDFIQQGCMFIHCIPDMETLQSLGFKSYPRWFREMPSDFQREHAKNFNPRALHIPFARKERHIVVAASRRGRARFSHTQSTRKGFSMRSSRNPRSGQSNSIGHNEGSRYPRSHHDPPSVPLGKGLPAQPEPISSPASLNIPPLYSRQSDASPVRAHQAPAIINISEKASQLYASSLAGSATPLPPVREYSTRASPMDCGDESEYEDYSQSVPKPYVSGHYHVPTPEIQHPKRFQGPEFQPPKRQVSPEPGTQGRYIDTEREPVREVRRETVFSHHHHHRQPPLPRAAARAPTPSHHHRRSGDFYRPRGRPHQHHHHQTTSHPAPRVIGRREGKKYSATTPPPPPSMPPPPPSRGNYIADGTMDTPPHLEDGRVDYSHADLITFD